MQLRANIVELLPWGLRTDLVFSDLYYINVNIICICDDHVEFTSNHWKMNNVSNKIFLFTAASLQLAKAALIRGVTLFWNDVNNFLNSFSFSLVHGSWPMPFFTFLILFSNFCNFCTIQQFFHLKHVIALFSTFTTITKWFPHFCTFFVFSPVFRIFALILHFSML